MTNDELFGQACTNGPPLNMEPVSVERLLEVVKQGQQITEDLRTATARALLGGGIQLIVNDDLQDDQYMVSRGVYEAAKRLGRGNA